MKLFRTKKEELDAGGYSMELCSSYLENPCKVSDNPGSSLVVG
jgi:hypothetical protein